MKFRAPFAIAVVVALATAASAPAQELPQGAQTAASPGGIVFDGSVPGGPLGDDPSTNFGFFGVIPAQPAVSSGPGQAGDPDMSKPWVMFTEFRYVGAWGCFRFVNLGPDNLVVENNGRSIAFNITCDGRGHDYYHVTVEAPDAFPGTIPWHTFFGGYRTGQPKAHIGYLQRESGYGRARVCGVGGPDDGRCYERPAGGHPGGFIATRTEGVTVFQRRTLTAGGTL